MADKKTFFDVVKERRTYYQLNKEAPISDERIEEIVKTAVLHTPSSFNIQSARLVVLLKKDHDLFWDMVKDVLKPLVPEENFPATEKKVNGFKAAYGTVRFTIRLSHALLTYRCRRIAPMQISALPICAAHAIVIS
jgi:predicted oxidoreductase (fatty acid repression mutant protein)